MDGIIGKIDYGVVEVGDYLVEPLRFENRRCFARKFDSVNNERVEKEVLAFPIDTLSGGFDVVAERTSLDASNMDEIIYWIIRSKIEDAGLIGEVNGYKVNLLGKEYVKEPVRGGRDFIKRMCGIRMEFDVYRHIPANDEGHHVVRVFFWIA